MVNPLEVRHRLRRRPFEPFRDHLQDGRSFDVRFPEINMVLKDEFLIGIPVPNDPDPVYQYQIHAPWESVTRVESIPQATPV